MDFSLKKLHFKFFRYILSRPYPFDNWLILMTSYLNLWIYSIIVSSILCFIVGTTFVEYMKFYFVINFFLMIFVIFSSYKLEFFRLVYHTIDQLFRMTIGRLFGLKPIDYNYKPISDKIFFKIKNDINENSLNKLYFFIHSKIVENTYLNKSKNYFTIFFMKIIRRLLRVVML